jgi:hypothetical protein
VNEELRSDPPADTPKALQLQRALKHEARVPGTTPFRAERNRPCATRVSFLSIRQLSMAASGHKARIPRYAQISLAGQFLVRRHDQTPSREDHSPWQV